MDAAAKAITIQPLGNIEPEPLERISQALKATYATAISICPSQGLPSSAWMPSRQQYDSAQLIQFLGSRSPARQEKVLGVCDVDLCTPVLTFVFGAAEVNGRFAIISLHRLRQEAYGLLPDRALFIQRCRKGAIHEIGHTCGLKHCFRYNCVMHPSESIEQTDLKRTEFCPSCLESLEALGWC